MSALIEPGATWAATSITGATFTVRILGIAGDGGVTFAGDLDGTLPVDRFLSQFRLRAEA
jgi:hypothetical protein